MKPPTSGLTGRARLRASLVAGLGLCACVPQAEEAGALELTHFVQRDAVGVFLNETLVLQFDTELDPASVTSASASVRSVPLAPFVPFAPLVPSANGGPAAGKFEVQGHRLLFRPDAPRDRNLGDGGFLPDTVYEVSLAGFPRPDGLRSRSGAVLAGSRRLRFRTARPGGATPLFEDPTPDGALPLQLETLEIGPLDPIVLYSADPLDPTSLRDGEFALATVRATEGGTELVREVIPLRPLIAENGPGGARLELWAAGEQAPRRALALGPYQLLIDPESFSLRDFGGHPVLPPVGAPGDVHRRIQVRQASPDTGRIAVHHESFLDTVARSPEHVAGTEGVARWSSNGVVSVWLPAAVGDGRDGHVVLGALETRRDVRAVRLTLAEHTQALLTPSEPAGSSGTSGTVGASGAGVIVLRSQGRMVLNGQLSRPSPGTVWERGPEESRTEWMDRAGMPWRLRATTEDSQVPEDRDRILKRGEQRLPEADWPAFQDWLAELSGSDEPWTVLVAGGDLEIGGSLRIDGPLMLVVGGWLRVTGLIEASQVWTLGDGGGHNVWPRARRPALRLHPPDRNPLREPMTWAVLSAPHRPHFGVLRWHPARVGGRGDFRVSFLGERDRAGGGVEILGPVEDPVLLADTDAVRVRIELTVAPGGVWDPPLVDFVELAWDEAD